MIRYISLTEIPQYLTIDESKTQEVFSKISSVRGYYLEDGVPKIKLSDLFDLQYYLLQKPKVENRFVEKTIGESDLLARLAVRNIMSQPITVSDLINGIYYCPECGSKRFEPSCATCQAKYNLPKTAKRIEIIADCEYKRTSLGYIIELMPVTKTGLEFRLAKVKMDGYKHPSLIYYKNLRFVDDKL
jgi:DNA-directed RNA polymerase subunit RPC12/RpoP